MPKATLTVPEIAALFRFSEWSVYEGVKAGTLPVPHLRLGARRIVFPVAGVARTLGMTVTEVMEMVESIEPVTPTTAKAPVTKTTAKALADSEQPTGS